MKSFKVASHDTAISVNDETSFKKGRLDSTFEELVVVGTELDIEIINHLAKLVKGK
ncbi:MAG: hypothetical protein R3B84_10025 [Zavarzinella sp.]